MDFTFNLTSSEKESGRCLLQAVRSGFRNRDSDLPSTPVCLSALSLSLSLSLPAEAVQEQLKVDQYSEGGTGHGSECRPGALTPSRPLWADPPLLHRDRDSPTGSSKATLAPGALL